MEQQLADADRPNRHLPDTDPWLRRFHRAGLQPGRPVGRYEHRPDVLDPGVCNDAYRIYEYSGQPYRLHGSTLGAAVGILPLFRNVNRAPQQGPVPNRPIVITRQYSNTVPFVRNGVAVRARQLSRTLRRGCAGT